MGEVLGWSRHKSVRNDERPWRDAVWLAGQEIRRAWLSYIVSAAYLGFFAALMVAGDAFVVGTYSFEIIMLYVLILATPFFARDYMSWTKNLVSERLTWWKSLPIGVPTIARARAIAVLAALPLNAIGFFGPPMVHGTWGMERTQFLWFGLAIIGCSLGGAGWSLVCEMMLTNRQWVAAGMILVVVYFVVLYILGEVFEIRLFAALFHAVEAHGGWVAAICLVAGACVFVCCTKLAEAGLRRREPGV